MGASSSGKSDSSIFEILTGKIFINQKLDNRTNDRGLQIVAPANLLRINKSANKRYKPTNKRTFAAKITSYAVQGNMGE
jgi:hypothetical protein